MHRAFAALLAGFGALAAADPGTRVGGQSQPVILGAHDRALVRETACSRYGVAADTVGPALRWTYGGRFEPVVEVAVRCAPHAEINGLPSHYNVECRRADDERDWRCLGWETIGVRTPIGEVSIEPGPYSHAFATRTVQAALNTSLYRREVREALPTGCRLAANWSGTGEEVAELSCASGHRFLFSFWCPTGDCPRLMSASPPGE